MKKTIILILLAVSTYAKAGNNTGSQPTTQPFWKNWYIQAGLDMSLMNPYGYNFSNVFPKGKTFGVDLAAGKWFSPEISLRARVKWENGLSLFRNNHLAWMGPWGTPNTNMDGGGYVAVYGDVLLNLSNIVQGYKAGRKWNALIFPRAGLVSNRATDSGSPMVGAGAGCTYRLNGRWSVYADAAYQVTTSEFFGGDSGTGMSVSAGSNGFFDFHFGVQFDLGKK